MEKNSIVEIYCGNYPNNHVTPNIASNPNFVFENDPEFQGVQLYDEDGNVVTVNSFTECEHYVLGGWDNTLYGTNELNFYNTTSILLTLSVLIYSLLKKSKYL